MSYIIEVIFLWHEGATTGAASGMVMGGVLGWLAGIGSLAIPGVGPPRLKKP